MGLVIGSMVPDLPYFVPLGLHREFTHSPIGALVADLPMGLIACALWALVLRAPIRDFLPAWLHDRYPLPSTTLARGRFVILLVTALVIGITTHLVWDSFTHPDGFVVEHVAVLRSTLGPFAVSRWLQYVSSVFGLAALAIWSRCWASRIPPSAAPYQRTSRAARRTVVAAIAGVLVIVALVVWSRGQLAGSDALNRSLVYATAVSSIAGAGLLGLVACLSWYLLPARSPD